MLPRHDTAETGTAAATVVGSYARTVRSATTEAMLHHDEPAIRWKTRVRVLGEDPGSRPPRRLQQEIRRSSLVRGLLDGHAAQPTGTYTKWQGAHWVLAALADIGHPGGPELTGLVDGVLATWLDPGFWREYVPRSTPPPRSSPRGVPVIDGRHRRCGSQQGSRLLSAVRLGVVDERAARLAERLEYWQWPDGGWNCDLDASAASSSVYETLLPMRGLAAYGSAAGDEAATHAARRAADVLLDRRVVFHRSSGELIDPNWARLHYPLYWRYDVLGGLKGLAELGLVTDDRCGAALDLLEDKELPDGAGWAAEARYYQGVGRVTSWYDHVDWGGVSALRPNPWVTVDALAVLAAAGRL